MSLTARSAATRAAIATGVVVALSTGGFALAATGNLPTLPDQASDQATTSVAKSRVTTAPTTAPTTATTTATTTAATETETDESTPTPNLEGLCKAFQANDKSLHGKSLDSAAFTALATAATAAGATDVATYCVTLVGEPKVKPVKPTPTNKPTTTGKPTAKPTPTNKPTAKPTQAVKGKSDGKGKADLVGTR